MSIATPILAVISTVIFVAAIISSIWIIRETIARRNSQMEKDKAQNIRSYWLYRQYTYRAWELAIINVIFIAWFVFWMACYISGLPGSNNDFIATMFSGMAVFFSILIAFNFSMHREYKYAESWTRGIEEESKALKRSMAELCAGCREMKKEKGKPT